MNYDPSSASHHYPNGLAEAIGCMKAADFETSGEYLVVFRDTEGKQVALRLLGTAIDSLVEKRGAL